MRRHIHFKLICLVGAVSMLCAESVSAEVMTWKVEGVTRKALVYGPSVPSDGTGIPLVFSFHGRGDDVDNFQLTELHVAWPEAMVVYFQGLETRSGLTGWQVERGDFDGRDLKLVDVALAWFREKFRIDEDRIYATGFSNGAAFTYLLWAERPEVFAAYAPVAGALRPTVHPVRPRPLFHIAGQNDPQVRFPQQREAMIAAIRINGVRDTTTRCGDGCTLYGSGTPAPVMTWIHRGGHVYPAWAAERITAFFQDHPRTR